MPESRIVIVFEFAENAAKLVTALKEKWRPKYWSQITYGNSTVTIATGWEDLESIWGLICSDQVDLPERVLSFI